MNSLMLEVGLDELVDAGGIDDLVDVRGRY